MSLLLGNFDQARICGTILNLPEFVLILVKPVNLLCIAILAQVELTAAYGAQQMERALGIEMTQMGTGTLLKDNLPTYLLLALLQPPHQKELSPTRMLLGHVAGPLSAFGISVSKRAR